MLHVARRISSMMTDDLEEVTDEAWLALLPALRGSALVHRGTGESIRLEGVVDLYFCDEQGVLQRRDGQCADQEPVWAAMKFQRALFQAKGGEDGKRAGLVISGPDKLNVWRDEYMSNGEDVRIFLPSNTSDMQLDVFRSSLPKPEQFVRWSAPSVVARVYGGTHAGDWICRHVSMWRKFLEKFNKPESWHIRPSLTSISHSARKRGDLPGDTALQECDPEFSLSSSCVCLIAAWFGLSRRLKTGAGVCLRGAAAAFIGDIFESFLPRDGVVLDVLVTEEECVQVEVSPKTVHVVGGAKVFANVLVKVLGGRAVGMAEGFLKCCDQVHCQLSRKRAVCLAVVSELVDRLAVEIDLNRDVAELFARPEDVDLALMRRDGSKRLRRVPIWYKQVVTDLADTDAHVKSRVQLIAADALIKQRRQRRLGITCKPAVVVKPQSATTWSADLMLAYLGAACRTFQSSGDCYVSIDGVHVAGKTYVLFAFGDPALNLHCWGPPQVRRDLRRKDIAMKPVLRQ
jgi:hypothetical protein